MTYALSGVASTAGAYTKKLAAQQAKTPSDAMPDRLRPRSAPSSTNAAVKSSTWTIVGTKRPKKMAVADEGATAAATTAIRASRMIRGSDRVTSASTTAPPSARHVTTASTCDVARPATL